MRCVLGFDGGGTKTDCVLMDESGRVLARSRAGPSNPTSLGVEVCLASLTEGAALALRSAAKAETEVASICAGISGASEPAMRAAVQHGLQPRFPNAAITVTSDLVISLAATGESPSVVVIAGTGSAVLGRTPEGKLVRAGGFGPVIGDPGSAYDLGRKTMAMYLQNHLRGQGFALGNDILRSFGCKFDDFFDRARAEPMAVFPKIFPIVSKAAQNGDEAARSLLSSAAKDLQMQAREVIEQLHLEKTDFFLAKTGGVFAGSAFLNQQFDALVREIAPKARVGPLPRSVAEAAAELARSALNSPLELAGN